MQSFTSKLTLQTIMVSILLGLSGSLFFNSKVLAQPATQVNGSTIQSNLSSQEFKFFVSGIRYIVKGNRLYFSNSNRNLLLTKEGEI